jgi:hypothetical protein
MRGREPSSEIHWAIWIGTGVICFGLAIYGAVTGNDIASLFILAMLIAAVTSVSAWVLPSFAARRTEAQPAEKAKRMGDDKLSLLMSLMDDDERVAFKEALKQRLLDSAAAPTDGELPYDAESLEALLDSQESGRRLSS